MAIPEDSSKVEAQNSEMKFAEELELEDGHPFEEGINLSIVIILPVHVVIMLPVHVGLFRSVAHDMIFLHFRSEKVCSTVELDILVMFCRISVQLAVLSETL